MKFITAFLVLTLTAQAHALDMQGVPCDEQADFAKLIAFKYRDNGFPEDRVKFAIKQSYQPSLELDLALELVAFAYSHPTVQPRDLYLEAYKECSTQNVPTL